MFRLFKVFKNYNIQTTPTGICVDSIESFSSEYGHDFVYLRLDDSDDWLAVEKEGKGDRLFLLKKEVSGDGVADSGWTDNDNLSLSLLLASQGTGTRII